MESKGAEKIAESKIQEVAGLKRLLEDYPVIGIANLENLPSPQLQKMRAQLKGKVLIKMSKKRLIKIAFDKTNREKLNLLKEKLKGIPALIFTKEDPFKLFKTLDKSKSSAPIKAGQKAPKDIVVPAGPTGFAPGPIISELSSAGLKTAIEGGKIVIKSEKVVAKEGEIVNNKVAGVLAKLGMEPMEIGINVVCVYDQGIIYNADVLSVDEKEYLNKIRTAQSESINLAVKIGYVVEETVKILLQKAERETKAVLDKSDFLTSDKARGKVVEAERGMENLKAKVGGSPEVEKKEEVKKENPEKEEPPKEEEKPEEKVEETPKEEKKEEVREKPKLEPKKEIKEEAKPEKKKEVVKKEEPKVEEEKPEKEEEVKKEEKPKEVKVEEKPKAEPRKEVEKYSKLSTQELIDQVEGETEEEKEKREMKEVEELTKQIVDRGSSR